MAAGPYSAADAGGAFPPPPPPPPPPHRLYRRRDDRVIAGVASGTAAYLGVDPVWVRLGFVLVTLFGGAGILIYIVAWIVVPEADGPVWAAPLRSWGGAPDLRVLLGVGLLIVAAFVLAGSLGIQQWGLLWGALLIAAGVALLVQTRWPAGAAMVGTASPTGSAAAAPEATAPIDPLTASASTATHPLTPSFSPSASAAWGRRAPAFPIGMLTSALAILAVGVIALLDNVGAVSVSVGTGIGIVLLVIGAGLVAGTWLGRSSWLLALGLLLLPFAAAASLVHQPLSGGAGDIRYAPQSLAALQPAYHLATGRLTVDLSAVAPAGVPINLTVTDAVGQVVVLVPADLSAEVHASAGAGDLRILGHEEGGYEVTLDETSTAAGAGTLHLRVSVGMGQVTVEESPAPAVSGAPAQP